MTGEKYYDYRSDCEKTIKEYLNDADPSGELAELFNDLCKWRSQRDDVNTKRHTIKTVTKEGEKKGLGRWDKEADKVVEVNPATENLNEAAEAFCHGYEEIISKTASTTLIPIRVHFNPKEMPQLKDIEYWSPTTYDPKNIKTVFQKSLSDEDWEVNRERGVKVGQGVKKAMNPRTLEGFEDSFNQWLWIVRIDKIDIGFSD